jgi:putative (di)nucleoside polyphosphate hydrolase
MRTKEPAPGYRACVGVMLVNRDGLVLVGRRVDTPIAAWQMPQGGIDPGEAPRTAALRELKEEVGTDLAEIVAESSDWLNYDLPPELQAKLWGGRYRGQTQKWFLARFTGSDADIEIDGAHREFDDWRWLPLNELASHIVAFKRAVYEAIVEEFRRFVAAARDPG